MKLRCLTITVIVLIVVFTVRPVKAENNDEFRPTYTIHGGVEVKVDTYFCDYPVINKDNWENFTSVEGEYKDIKEKFPTTNPSHPNLVYEIGLDLYANPFPDFELFVKPKFIEDYLAWEQFYTNYFSDRAMYTIGRFSIDLGVMGLLWSEENPFEGVMVNTQWKNTWITVVAAHLNKVHYPGDKEFPIVLTEDTDNLIGCRLTRKYGNNLVGLNLLVDGFQNEQALSLDFNGKIGGHSVTAELGIIYPCLYFRDIVLEHEAGEDAGNSSSGQDPQADENSLNEETSAVQVDEIKKGYYPGMVVSINLVENSKQMLRLTVGGMTKGFVAFNGDRCLREVEEAVKFGRNLWGVDLLHQYLLGENWILVSNLTWMEVFDQAHFDQYQKHFPLPTRSLSMKIKKQITPRSEISGTLSYLGDDFFDYGRFDFNWKTVF